jgi:hypothetical protein
MLEKLSSKIYLPLRKEGNRVEAIAKVLYHLGLVRQNTYK